MDIAIPSLPTQAKGASVSVFAPMRMLDLELSRPLPVFSALDPVTNQVYQRALCLVRLHTRLIGTVELFFIENDLQPRDYAKQIWAILGPDINKHLQGDGLTALVVLDENGVPFLDKPRCIEERECFLEHAPFISVIVPTYNRPDLIQNCVESLLALYYPNYEIIVVDNAPKDEKTAEALRRISENRPQVRYVREERAGVARARNLGMQVAKGTILTYVDDDVTIDPYLLIEIAQAFNAAENVACVTGNIFPLELETPAQFLIEEYGGYSKGFARQIFDLKEHRPADLPLYPYTAGRFGAGANMSFKATYLRSVGGFDVRFQYGSDIEALFQVVVRGYRLVYEPTALVRHPHYREYGKLQKQLYNYGTGLTAFLTKAMRDRPSRLLALITKIPSGLYFILRARSPKNQKKQPDYPRELTMNELKGMLLGPFIHVRSRWATRG